jgi:hypothetical protein
MKSTGIKLIKYYYTRIHSIKCPRAALIIYEIIVPNEEGTERGTLTLIAALRVSVDNALPDLGILEEL